MTTSRPKILKVLVGNEPVRVTDSKTLLAEAHSEAERLVQDARDASERIRRGALQAAESERQAARSEAERIVGEANANKESIYQEARGRAMAEAEAVLFDSLRPRLEQSVADFEALVRGSKDIFETFLESQRDEVVAFAIEVAQTIVQYLCENDRELIVRTARSAIERASERRELTLRIHPDDLKVTEEFRTELIHHFDDLKTLRIEPDTRVDRGGVWVETETGVVDGRIRTQIEEIRRSVLPEKE